MRQIILDTETTGLRPEEGHRLVEIGCLELVNRKLTGKKFYSRLNPERKVDSEASRITGITTDMLLHEPKFQAIVDEFINFIADSEIIIHNASFDLGFINKELSLINHSIKDLRHNNKIIDTLEMARSMFPNQRNNLDALCKRFNVDNNNRELHGALLDAELLAHVYLNLTKGQSSLFEDTTEHKASNNLLFQEIRRTGPLWVIKSEE